MKPTETIGIAVVVWFILLTVTGCSNDDNNSFDLGRLAATEEGYVRKALFIRQELVNDQPIGPGQPQPSNHCPEGPGRWLSGSGRSTATSNLFGDLNEVEVYCINVDRSELSGGLATWTDIDGDSISMIFGAKLLEGSVYTPAPNAPMVGFAHFTGGTGKWAGLVGVASLTGRQNGDGTATIHYRGTIYLPR